MNIHPISREISYIAASDDPLSADIGIVQTDHGTWLYDVGNDKSRISSLTGRYNVVLSHFHPDHIGSLDHLDVENLYVTRFTLAHTGRGTVVEEELYIDGLHIFPLPSSHAKGSLGLEVGGEYAFIGDAIYSRSRPGYYVYNAQLLKEEIEVLKKLNARQLLVSQLPGMVMAREDVLRQLEEIYSQREKSSSEILIEKT